LFVRLENDRASSCSSSLSRKVMGVMFNEGGGGDSSFENDRRGLLLSRQSCEAGDGVSGDMGKVASSSVADESPASVASWNRRAAAFVFALAPFFLLGVVVFSNSRACEGSTAPDDDEMQFPIVGRMGQGRS
jgi:hypothetical protein